MNLILPGINNLSAKSTLNGGKVIIYDRSKVLLEPFVDISSRVSTSGEQGLLSIAFHPDYESNGFFFVNYTDTSGGTVIARYSVSGDPDVADPHSAYSCQRKSKSL